MVVGRNFLLEEKGRVAHSVKLNFRSIEWIRNEKVAFIMTSGNFVKGIARAGNGIPSHRAADSPFIGEVFYL